jgi:hypothetical protein
MSRAVRVGKALCGGLSGHAAILSLTSCRGWQHSQCPRSVLRWLAVACKGVSGVLIVRSTSALGFN